MAEAIMNIDEYIRREISAPFVEAIHSYIHEFGPDGFANSVVPVPKAYKMDNITFGKSQYFVASKDGWIPAKIVAFAGITVFGEEESESFGHLVDFTISFKFRMKDGAISDFGITNICNENHLEPFDPKRHVSNFLVPYVYRNMEEDVADEFLRLYYPEALEKPVPVKTEVIIERMGLKRYLAPLGKKISGRSFFRPGKAIVYDGNNEPAEVDVSPGAILVNVDMFFEKGSGWFRNTDVHECLHFHMHKNFFEAEKVIHPDEAYIECAAELGQEPKLAAVKNRYFMEQQVSRIAPKVLMNRHMAPKIYDLSLKKARIGKKGPVCTKDLQKALRLFAEYCGVSITSAKIRLVELGYKEMSGIYCNINGESVGSYKCSRKDLEKNQTYELDFRSAVNAMGQNEKLRKLVSAGYVTYVDGKFVINDPKYIKRYKTKPTKLTQYARNHMSECAFLFTVEVGSVTVEVGADAFGRGTADRADGYVRYSMNVSLNFTDESNRKVAVEAMNTETIKGDIEDAIAMSRRMTECGNFAQALDLLLSDEYCGGPWSDRKVAEECDMSKSAISDFRTGKTHPSLECLLAIIAGIGFHPLVSKTLIKLAHYNLSDASETLYIYYNALIECCPHAGLKAWNSLISQDFPGHELPKPITSCP